MPTLEVHPHRVDINGRFLTQRVTGVQRYARETLRCLDELLAEHAGAGIQWRLLVPLGTEVPPLKFLHPYPVGRSHGHLWEQLELPFYTAGRLLFSFGFTGPLLKQMQIITVHDAAVVRQPHAFKRLFRLAYLHLIRNVGQRAQMVMAVSDFSRREATQCFGITPDKLHATTEGWQHLLRLRPDKTVLDVHGLRGKRFILAVSSPTPNKNFAVIARALELMGVDAPVCVVVGAADAAIFANGTPSERNLHRVGYVSDEQLKALYCAATCFVFPSFYEGFGLPPLEAMASGCPVICSDAAVLAEVCAEAALYFRADSPEELASQLQRLMADEPLRKGLLASAAERVRLYSWRLAAELNLTGIQRALAAHEALASVSGTCSSVDATGKCRF